MRRGDPLQRSQQIQHGSGVDLIARQVGYGFGPLVSGCACVAHLVLPRDCSNAFGRARGRAHHIWVI